MRLRRGCCWPCPTALIEPPLPSAIGGSCWKRPIRTGRWPGWKAGMPSWPRPALPRARWLWRDREEKRNRRHMEASTPSRRRRLLLLTVGLGVGGTEGQILELASQLDRGRFAVAVCVLKGDGVIAQELRDRGVRVVTLNGKGA